MKLTRMVSSVVATVALTAVSAFSHAANLTVTHWADGMYGVPFAVALEKGYFKEAGVDVTGFITSQGGGTTVRNAMASEIPYGEVALPAAIAAAKQGVDLTIVHAGVVTLADLYWVVKPDSPLTSIQGLKGKKMGYSSPKSVTDMVSTLALNKVNLLSQVERKSVGGLSSAMTSLREGAVDSIYVIEPVYSREQSHFKVLFKSADLLPGITQTVGVVRTDYLKKNPEQIKGIIAARRKGVEFIEKNPAEAAQIMAKHYKLPVEVAKAAIDNVIAGSGKSQYWSSGRFDYEGMNTMVKGLALVKALDSDSFDWSKIVNEGFLPADLRSK